MSEALSWLLRLDELRFGDPGVEFGFARDLPLWGWALAALAAAALGWACYRRLEGPRGGRIALAALRAATLLLLAVIIAGPHLFRPNETEEADWVLVLVDRSASLTIRDVGGDSGASRQSREQQLRQALEASGEVWRGLSAERVVVWMGFDATAWEMKPGDSATPSLGEPVGRRTDLNRALDAALKRAAARPLSGVVILSDGRSVDPPSRAMLRRLEAEKVPVFTVALGSERGVADLAVRRAEAPRTAFVNDTVPVRIELERIGEPGRGTPADATVELVDTASGVVLDTQRIEFAPTGSPGAQAGPAENDAASATVTLVTRPKVAGRSSWAVRIKPGDSGAATDLIETNNQVEVPVELVDRPLRVLYLDGYPRWEYRYLKNVLVRENSVAAAVTMVAPGRRYIQEGSEIIDALPSSPEEWGRWDVVILGDVVPSVFTPDQLRQLRDRVATAGLGLVWIGGEGAVPDAWRGTPLGDLIPFTAADAGFSTLGSAASATAEWGEPVVMSPTPTADDLGVLRLLAEQSDGSWWPGQLSDPATGWSQLRWAQRIDPSQLKPTTEVLAMATPALDRVDDPARTAPSASPLLMTMRFGAGRIVYLATDEVWRWRYGRGEFYTERFWLQIIRLLGRESVARSGKAAILQALPDRGQTDRPIRIELTLLDQALMDARPDALKVRVKRLATASGEAVPEGTEDVAELTLVPEGSDAATRRSSRTFAATWIPTSSGQYRVDATDPLLVSRASGSAGEMRVKVQVWQPDDELRQPQADHPALETLSRATGGEPLTAEGLARLPSLLPNRRLRLAGEPDVQTLWDTPLALILLVGLLTAEWIGRRLLRLA